MTHLELLTDFYRVIWQQGDVGRIDSYFLPETETEGFFPDMSVRREDFQAMVLAVNRLVEDMQIDILRTTSEGDWVAALVRARCISRDSGRSITLTGQAMVRFQDGKIAEAHNHMDLLGFFAQLGLLPEDLSIRLLGGAQAA